MDIVLTRHAKAPFQVVKYASVYAARSNRDFDEIWVRCRRRRVRSGVSRSRFSQCADAHKRILKHVPGYEKTRLNFEHHEYKVHSVVKKVAAAKAGGGRRAPG